MENAGKWEYDSTANEKDAMYSHDPVRLAELAKSRYPDTRHYVARNRHADIQTQRDLASDSIWYVRRWVAEISSDAVALAKLAEREDGLVTGRLQAHDPNEIDNNLETQFAVIERVLADNPATPRAVLLKLHAERGEPLRRQLNKIFAGRADTPVEQLRELGELCDLVARPSPIPVEPGESRRELEWALSKNPNTPPELLVLLGGPKENVFTRENVAANPSTPHDTVLQLAVVESASIRAYAGRNPKAGAPLLSLLSRDTSAQVRRDVATNESLPVDLMEKLSRDRVGEVKRYLTFNKAVPDSIVERLAADKKDEHTAGCARRALEERKKLAAKEAAVAAPVEFVAESDRADAPGRGQKV